MMQEMNTDLVDNQIVQSNCNNWVSLQAALCTTLTTFLQQYLAKPVWYCEMPPDCVGRDRIERVEKTAKYAARLVGSLMAYVSGRETFQETVDLNL
ncbi:MAG: hypothetical protein R3E31_30200 [Chloroflexota bacterium]